MPLYLIHGDHQIASREHLNQTIHQFKTKGYQDLIRLEGKKLTLTDLIQATQSSSLFGTDKQIVIENLHNRPRSKLKQNLIHQISTHSNNSNSSQVILWEDKLLTSPQIKKLGNPAHQAFKLPKTLFRFLDSFYPGNTHACYNLYTQTLQHEPAELIFAMLIRHIRLLLQLSIGETPKMAPWQLNKLKPLQQRFSANQLKSIHHSLLQLDIAIKTSHNVLPLQDEIKLLIVKYIA